MAITENTFTGDGSTTNYSFTFPYLNTTDIKVSLNGVDTTAYSLPLPNVTTISFNIAPPDGVAIRIYRDTNVDSLQATFYPGSAIKADDLNGNFNQNNYSAQESKAQASQAPTALTNSITAVNTANQAVADATTALTAVNNVVSTQVVTNVAGLNAISTSGLSNGHMVDVSDSTGIESVLTDEPAGFVGASDLRVRVSWNGTTWTYQRYEATDPDSRYILDGTGTVRNNHIANNAVRTADIKDDAVTTDKIINDAVTADKLQDTTVTAGSYTYASVTVDAQGRLTAASDGTTPLTNSDIGSTVQAYDADTAKLDVAQTFTTSQTFTADATFAASQTFPKVPANAQTSAYTLVAADAGKHISTTGNVTVPSGQFSIGDAISIYNKNSQTPPATPIDITITGPSVTLRQAGTSNTGDRTLAQHGLATILCVATDDFVITGGGLS